MKRTKMEKGITLVALIITIIVLLILAMVAIGSLTGEHAVVDQAEEATNQYQIKAGEEEEYLNGAAQKIETMLNDANAGNGGTTGKVNVALGSYVTYKGITWRVLKNDSSSVELITENFTVSRTIAGTSDYATVMHIWGDSKMLIDSDLVSGTGISKNIRSVKETDMEKLQTLGLADINNDYWLYDTVVIPEPDAPYSNMKGYYWKYVDSNGNVQNAFLFYTYDPMSVQRTDSHTKQLRPIITLSAGALDNVTGSGTSGQPYVLN